MMEDREPVWNAENINREKGSTTFKTCGWCKHAGGGSYRYNGMISGSCSLLKSYRNEVKFDTPCKIVVMGKDDIQAIIEHKEYEISSHEGGIKREKEEIKALRGLKPKKTPPLPENRPYDYYKNGERVFVFHEGGWRIGTVCSGYRSGDGCVSYVLDAFPESQAGKKGPWGCGSSVPCILKEWEVKYFKTGGDFKAWLSIADKEYNGKRLPVAEYIEAFKKLSTPVGRD